MVEYDNDNHCITGGKKLITQMNITVQGGKTVDLSKGGVLIEGSGEKIVYIAFERVATRKDQPLPHINIESVYFLR